MHPSSLPPFRCLPNAGPLLQVPLALHSQLPSHVNPSLWPFVQPPSLHPHCAPLLPVPPSIPLGSVGFLLLFPIASGENSPNPALNPQNFQPYPNIHTPSNLPTPQGQIQMSWKRVGRDKKGAGCSKSTQPRTPRMPGCYRTRNTKRVRSGACFRDLTQSGETGYPEHARERATSLQCNKKKQQSYSRPNVLLGLRGKASLDWIPRRRRAALGSASSLHPALASEGCVRCPFSPPVSWAQPKSSSSRGQPARGKGRALCSSDSLSARWRVSGDQLPLVKAGTPSRQLTLVAVSLSWLLQTPAAPHC